LRYSTTPEPSNCRHYQAITRVAGADGTPFFLVTRNGNTPETPGDNELNCFDSASELYNGNLVVFKMGSRDKNGERLRSNRLRKGVHVDNTPPPPEDIATIFFTVVGGDPADPDPAKHPGLVLGHGEGGVPPRVYAHPGGMQLVGHMLAMAMDTRREPSLPPWGDDPYEIAPSPTLIMFLDVSDPEAPRVTSSYVPLQTINGNDEALRNADGIGITPSSDGSYLMVVTGGFADTFFFYKSTLANSQEIPNVLESPDLNWLYLGKAAVPKVEDHHQTLHFLRQGDIKGPLYLAGARGHPVFADHDRIDLYQVLCATPEQEPVCADGLGIRLATTGNSGTRITPFPNTGGTNTADLAAASGFYESPSGELLFYATQHYNKGPGDTVNMGEWRHIDVVRKDSPTYLPTAVVNGPYEVDEGSSVSLSGSARPPITKAWIELFRDQYFGGPDFATQYPVVDYDDYDLDDFNNFSVLEFQFPTGDPTSIPPFTFTNKDHTQSWKWFAPAGCSIRAQDNEGTRDDDPILVGSGVVRHETYLTTLQVDDGRIIDFDSKLDSVDFLAGCDQYYNSPFDLKWDLDVNGSYETTGSPVTFRAIAFDGPSVVTVPAQAQSRLGGAAGQATVRITVHNVAPELTAFHLTDAAGHELNTSVPFVLTGQPVTVGAGFNDPGVLDHQTATLAWGDGSVETQTAFTTFDEAFGDGTGAVLHRHRYTVAGSYPLVLSVTDDDDGTDTESTVVRVLTPEQAVGELVSLLNSAIAGATNDNVRKDLEKARKALAGSNDLSNNGALKMIRAGNNQAAIAFLQQAITWLRKAQAGGSDVTTLIALLEQVIAALSA